MKTLTHFSLLVLLLSLVACTGGTSSSDPASSDPASSGPASSVLDPVDCTAFAQSMANAATGCGTALPAGGQAAVESWCKAGIANADLCGGNPSTGLDCFATPDATDWTCSAREPLPACGGNIEAALGAFCLMSLGNPACGSIACVYDVDCGTGSSCNSVTGKCFRDAAYCVGMSWSASRTATTRSQPRNAPRPL